MQMKSFDVGYIKCVICLLI